ncbi:hypothetical protein C364_00207 [Cryptococcus neoformans Bt63]|nr:hypothetical protein C364_00207 [Cryptococcus neoformans var. grubii Bt63]
MSTQSGRSTTSRSSSRKKPLSCAECRRLKLKCELVFPCRHCVKRGLANICPEGELVNGSRRTKILASTEDLHNRIAALEEALKAATSPHHPLLQDSLYANRKEIRRRRSPSSSLESSIQPPSDCLTSFSHLTLGDDPHFSRYYGAASSVYLSKQQSIPESCERFVPSDESVAPHQLHAISYDYTDLFPPFSSVHNQLDIDDIFHQYLPPPEIGLTLAEVYFHTFGWFTNIVQRPSWDDVFFHHVYRDSASIRSNPLKPQRLAVVLLVFALGALMDLSKPPHNEEARHYFNGARACLSLDPSHSVTYVQCIYLYGSYLMNRGKDTSGGDTFWPLLRMGMAVCEAIGLHRDGSNWGLEEDQAMVRRIVFWEIHGYDVLQSTALGRGMCISDASIDCQVPLAETDSGFHAKAYALTKIWSQINEKQVRIKPFVYSEVAEIDKALCAFQDDLPYHLSPSLPPSPDDLTNLARHKEAFQRNTLLLYINEAKLTLHRGWFIRALREYPDEPLSSPFKHSYLSCLEACRGVVFLVRNMLILHGQLIHRRWHFFFHLFAACVCLAAAVIRAPASSLVRSILAELESGINIFKIADREELIIVNRLREKAVRAMQNISSSSFNESEAETEDLDLLGARTTLRRVAPKVSPHEQSGIIPLTVPLFYEDTSVPQNAERTEAMTAMLDVDDTNQGNLEWNDFDMDSFLREIGAI